MTAVIVEIMKVESVVPNLLATDQHRSGPVRNWAA